jgi:predicted MFS family arabinose efflux permease
MLNPRIYLLALGTFTVGTEGYVIAGVLPAVARDMQVSVAMCGQLVTVFAVTYALAGPPLIGLLRSLAPKRLLVGAALFFAGANLLAALAPDIAVLVAARVLAALGAALFMAPAAAAAAALSTPEELPRAISVTASGNALALTAGAPVGTVIGSAFGWRASFAFVTVLAVLTAIVVWRGLPTVPTPTAATGGRLALLRSGPIRWALLTTGGLFLATYAVYTYLAPIVGASTGLGSGGVALLMVVFGAGGITGGRMIGRVLTRYPIATVLRAALTTVAALIALLVVLTGIHQFHQVAVFVAFPLMLCLGAAWWSGGISQQTRIASLAPDHRSQALGLHFSSQYLGVTVGGALGGLALSGLGPTAVPVLGSVVAALTITTVRHVLPPRTTTERVPPPPTPHELCGQVAP